MRTESEQEIARTRSGDKQRIAALECDRFLPAFKRAVERTGIVASNKIESQADPEKTKNPADKMDMDIFIFTPVL
jgi:hypothetical protein